MSEYYPYGHQSINDDDIASVIEALKSDWLTTGPAVDNFESAVASRVGADYAVSFSSGTAALHGAMHAAGVSSGDSVIVPSLTFAATGNAAIYRGGRPVIADISPDTLCMSRSSAERAIATAGSPIRVIAPVSYAGYPVDIASFMELAGKHDAVVIEDASHAMGAARGTRTVGQEADMTVFSFHPLKHITTGEGGMVVTNSETFAKKLRLFRSHGITKSPDEFGRKYDGPWDNDMIELGYNYRLTDLACALGSSQLKRLDTFIAQRRAIAARYRKSLSGADGVTLPPEHPGHAYHLFPIQVPHSVRRKAFESLRNEGIGVQVHYVPLHLHSYYRKNFGTNEGDCPNAEAFSSGEISLPIYPDLSNESAVYIADKLKNILTAILR
jgi:UDP-4-amino-4,6-dideoxy-N-acetyl-beta-L-altrosamine transaminase